MNVVERHNESSNEMGLWTELEGCLIHYCDS